MKESSQNVNKTINTKEPFKEGKKGKKILKKIANTATNVTKKATTATEKVAEKVATVAKKAVSTVEDALKTLDLNKLIKDPIDKEANKIFDGVKKFTDKTLDALRDATKDVEKALKKSVQDIESVITDDLKKGFDPSKGIDVVIKEFSNMVKFSKTIDRRFENVFVGVGSVFYGLGLTIEGIGKGIGLGFNQIGELFQYIGEFMFTYLVCIVKMLNNIWGCFFYYLVELFLQILYLPVRIMLYIAYAVFGVDLYERERQAFQGLYDMSYLMYKYTGYHFMYWPKPIREKCFVCVRLKTDTVSAKAAQVDEVFTKKLPDFMQQGIKLMQKSSKHFQEVGAYPNVKRAKDVK